MRLDPCRILQQAAEQRIVSELLPRGGRWLGGRVLRVESSGVVLGVPDSGLHGGEDVQVWLRVDDELYHFTASVLRVGVPVPDRSQDGVLLGYLDGFERIGEDESAGDRDLSLLPPSGPGVSLLGAPARLVELTVDSLVFTVPPDFHLVLALGGLVQLRMAVPGQAPLHLGARVRDLVRGDGYLLYELGFTSVDDRSRLPGMLSRLGALQS